MADQGGEDVQVPALHPQRIEQGRLLLVTLVLGEGRDAGPGTRGHRTEVRHVPGHRRRPLRRSGHTLRQESAWCPSPGPAAAFTSRGPILSPHEPQTSTASADDPQSLWVTTRGGPAGAE